ncbi:MAG: 50S ribosome-binding GTPase [Micrococcaceae bacterium]
MARKPNTVSYAERLGALEHATQLADNVLPESLISESKALISRASERRKYSADHTVVAFIGATGSGKSSLLNAIAGQEVARSAAIRPTTSEPLAIMWDSVGSESLLSWLDVKERHELSPDPELSGLILLDLPDFDSTSDYNRQVVDKLVGMVDVLVWVMDPQKYADATIHQKYIQPWGNEDAVTFAVLNQIDKIRPNERQEVINSMHEVLIADGLKDIKIFPVSAKTKEGIPELKHTFSQIAQARAGAIERWNLDAKASANKLAAASGDETKVGIDDKAKAQLVTSLSAASGIDEITEKVRKSYLRGTAINTGWPVTRWLKKLRPDPLKKLGIENTKKEGVSTELRRSSRVMSPVQKAAAHNAVRDFVDDSASSASEIWKHSIRQTGSVDEGQIVDLLDQAIVKTNIAQEKKPFWWKAMNLLQYLALLVGVVGLAWLVLITALEFFQVAHDFNPPNYNGVPIPTLLLAAGLISGLLIALISRIFGSIGGIMRAKKVRKQFNRSIMSVADQNIITPVQGDIDRYHEFTKATNIARS